MREKDLPACVICSCHVHDPHRACLHTCILSHTPHTDAVEGGRAADGAGRPLQPSPALFLQRPSFTTAAAAAVPLTPQTPQPVSGWGSFCWCRQGCVSRSSRALIHSTEARWVCECGIDWDVCTSESVSKSERPSVCLRAHLSCCACLVLNSNCIRH